MPPIERAPLLEIHGIGQNFGPLADGMHVIFEALLKLDGEDLQIALDVETTVTLNDYDLPVGPLAELLVYPAGLGAG